MKIVEASPNSLDEILALEQASFSVPWSKQSFLDVFSSEAMTLYAAYGPNGHLYGFACLGTVLDEGEVLDIAVDESYRQSGIGSLLLSHMISEAPKKGISVLFLEVRVSNHPAKHLYQKFGFEPIGLRKNYYSLPAEDAVIMKKMICAESQTME